MRADRRTKIGIFCALVTLAGAPAPAWAEYEVRISIAEGQEEIVVEGRDLAIYDPNDGYRVAGGKGDVRVVTRPDGPHVEIEGEGLQVDRGHPSARWLFEAEDGVRVDGRLFLGRVIVRRTDAAGLHAINRLPLETYLLGIVGSEMSPSWPAEALKAQAVAARTYALDRRLRMRAAGRPYDLESSVISQVYAGADRITDSVVSAVQATRGEVIAYHHRLVEALFHSTCGGATVASEAVFPSAVPYLRSRPCTWCAGSSRYRWTVTVKLSELSERLGAAKLLRGRVRSVRRGEGDTKVVINGKQRLDPRRVRKALGFSSLWSERFTAKTDGSTVHFEGRGFGHGVGMCQWGAKGMADETRSYRDILTYYYQGAEVRRLY